MSLITIKHETDRFLNPLGFQRRNSTWVRRSGIWIDVLSIQISKSLQTFTLNAGVLHPAIFKIIWGEDLPATVDEASCLVRARVGDLGDGCDIWWDIADTGSITDALDKVEQYMLPFIERMHSLDAITEYLKRQPIAKTYPLPNIIRAVVMIEQGNRDEGCALLRMTADATRSLAWRSRVHEIISRVGCELQD